MRRAILAAVVTLAVTPLGLAQAPEWRFQWKAAQLLNYKVEHNTTVAETIKMAREQTTSKLKLHKQWKVISVDDKGIATLELTLLSMRNEQIRPNGDSLLFDSTDLDKSTPALKEQLMKFVNTPVAEVRIDAAGKVVEVKSGPPLDRYDSEPPFLLTIPVGPARPKQTWERKFTIVLSPPLGTGEKYEAVQEYHCKEMNLHYARVAFKTTIKDLPASPLDQVPLLPKLAKGEVIFSLLDGRMHSVRAHIERELQDHQGKGSSYHFKSDYKEDFVPPPTGGK
jgi:hypothetical protein